MLTGFSQQGILNMLTHTASPSEDGWKWKLYSSHRMTNLQIQMYAVYAWHSHSDRALIIEYKYTDLNTKHKLMMTWVSDLYLTRLIASYYAVCLVIHPVFIILYFKPTMSMSDSAARKTVRWTVKWPWCIIYVPRLRKTPTRRVGLGNWNIWSAAEKVWDQSLWHSSSREQLIAIHPRAAESFQSTLN